MTDAVSIAFNYVIAVTFNRVNNAIFDFFDNTDMISPAIILLAILIPVKGDDIARFRCRITIFIPNT